MEKVTVYISKELKRYLKEREIPMSQWIRQAIGEKKKKISYIGSYQKKRYRENLDFRTRIKEKSRNLWRKKYQISPNKFRR